MNRIDSRRRVLREFGANGAEIDELLEYTRTDFKPRIPTVEDVADEPFVEAWREYAREAEVVGACAALRKRLVQLSFPIREGISSTPAYLAAVRRGESPLETAELALGDRVDLRLEIHASAAGHIPLLITSSRLTFVSLVRALTRRNEPEDIPDAVGASMVAGYANWDRVRSYRRTWEHANPGCSWAAEFPRLVRRKHLYQDRFIILSDGPYSGVEARTIGLPDEVWRAASLIIRREHECTHYFTKRIFGSMRNNLFDELIADYIGIVEVCGRFRSDWFLRFMGLEDYPIYRQGGRFEHYVCGLSTAAVPVLMRLLIQAASKLEADSLSDCPRFSCRLDKVQALCALSPLTIEELATLERA